MHRNSRPTFVLSAPCCPTSCHHHQYHFQNKLFNDNCVFQVAWAINPHMKIGAACPEKALQQHSSFTHALKEAGAQIITLPFVHGAYDSVFMKDSAILKRTARGTQALLTRPRHKERHVETQHRQHTLTQYGFQVCRQSYSPLEGGDVVIDPYAKKAFMGFGFRSSRKAVEDLQQFLGMEVIPLELKNPLFYHLDVALAILNDGTALACKEAFTDESWQTLQREMGRQSLIAVAEKDARHFGLNWVEVGNTIILGSFLPRLMEILKALGKKVRYTPLDQFQLAGGSAACLVSRVHEDWLFDSTSTAARV